MRSGKLGGQISNGFAVETVQLYWISLREMITIKIWQNITKKSINISTGLDYPGFQMPDKPLLQLVFLTAQVFTCPSLSLLLSHCVACRPCYRTFHTISPWYVLRPRELLQTVTLLTSWQQHRMQFGCLHFSSVPSFRWQISQYAMFVSFHIPHFYRSVPNTFAVTWTTGNVVK
jgi:hypothetical protein